jgi:ABC-2 type transport system permease protein
MSGPLPSAPRVAWLLVTLRLRRLLNMTGAFKLGKGPRTGTRPRKRTPVLLTAFIALWMMFGSGAMAVEALAQLTRLVGDEGSGPVFAPALQQALALTLALLMLGATLIAIASRELAQADWDLEWLVTLPAETGTLLWSRIAERSLANVFGVLGLWPVCGVLAWQAGWRLAAPLLGLVLALPLLALVAMLQTLVDTGLRLRLSPSRLRNLQAVISVLSLGVLYLAMSPALAGGGGYIVALAGHLPDMLRWTPPGLVVQLLAAPGPAQAAGHAALLLAEVVLLLALGMRWLRALLAPGVVAAGTREAGRGATTPTGWPARGAQALAEALAQGWGRGGWLRLGPVQRRELTLLARDRNFLVQTLLMPVLIVALQWAANSRMASWAELWQQPQAVAAAAFGVAAYALVLSAFQTLHAEGGALWLLYSFPRSIESVLRDKARLWSVLALVYPVIAFVLLLVWGPAPGLDTLGLAAMVVVGVPLYAAIAVALGVFASDPLATDTRQRVKPTYLYLYMLLSGAYAYALVAPQWWQAIVFIVLVALLAQALWQKARDQLPFLLDPAAGPPARVSTADGLIAAMLFFVLQIATLALMLKLAPAATVPPVVPAFAVAGLLTYAGVRYTQWRTRLRDVPRVWGPGWRQALGSGLPWGLAAAAAGIGYLEAVRALGLLDALVEGPLAVGGLPWAWLLVLTVLAAPLCEEYIFRGLVFGGLRRSMRLLPAAVASAAIFAIVHPPIGMIPVFALGLAAAAAYERSRLLLAPMLVHAVYNAAVVGWQARW